MKQFLKVVMEMDKNTLDRLEKYCKENKLDYQDFIENNLGALGV